MLPILPRFSVIVKGRRGVTMKTVEVHFAPGDRVRFRTSGVKATVLYIMASQDDTGYRVCWWANGIRNESVVHWRELEADDEGEELRG